MGYSEISLMNLAHFSIKRPVTTVMIFLALLLLGIISWQRLPQELFPPVTYPKLTISTAYQNAAPEEIETLITKPLEEVVGTVSGLKRITSVSKEGLSLITIEFSWGTNMDFASLNVREKIDLVKERLPREAEDPIIMKFNPFELPVVILSVTQSEESSRESKEFQQAELLRLSRKYIKDELEKVNGVAYARITGGIERQISIKLDQGRLFASNISILDVVEALRQSNLNYPAGSFKGDFYEYLIRTIGEFEKISDIEGVPVSLDEFKNYSKIMETQGQQEKSGQRRLIFLSDVGEVDNGYKEVTSFSRYNGKDNVAISVFKQSGFNTVAASKNVKYAIEKLKETLPKGISVKIIYDQAAFIKSSINGVKNAGIMGGILAFMVLMLFLQNYRSSVIIVVAIPISILVVFSLMYMQGISLNIISLGGLALGIGMLVDNSIVVIENIFRYREKTQDSKLAAVEGSKEVTGAITSSTLTSVAVFIPMIFVIGIAGQLFKELAFTVTFSLLASLMVALTLVPLLCAGKGSHNYGAVEEKKSGIFVSFFEKIENSYARFLERFLKARKKGLWIIFIVFLLSLLIFLVLDKELMPKIDEGQFTVKIDMPAGTLLEITDTTARKIEESLISDKNIKDVMVNVGSSGAEKVGESLASHQAEILVNLQEKRKISTSDFMTQVKEKIERLELRADTIEYSVRGNILTASNEESAPVIIEIKGENLQELNSLAKEVQKNIKGIEGVYGIKNSMEANSPETEVSIIKDKAWLYDLSAADIARIVQVAVKGYVATKFKEDGEEIDIRVMLDLKDRKDTSALERLIVHTPLEVDIPLKEVAVVSQGKGPSAIKRMDRERTIIISANLAGKKLSKATKEIESKLKNIEEPAGYSINFGGENKEMKESFASLRFALILSIVLIYMIMAAQFESLWQPFIIMVTVPLSIIGVAVALLISNTSVNVIVLLGMIVLGGIVVNNGIVLINYINILVRERNMPIYEAAIEASRVRLRPILMTALTTILGLTPLAFKIGDKSGLQSPMAVAVMGGLSVSTFLTLLVVPAIYMIIAEKMEVKSNK
ncbi:MAG: efflux RND transporter permease subunit [Candidatus Omnitrophota bacterium]